MYFPNCLFKQGALESVLYSYIKTLTVIGGASQVLVISSNIFLFLLFMQSDNLYVLEMKPENKPALERKLDRFFDYLLTNFMISHFVMTTFLLARISSFISGEGNYSMAKVLSFERNKGW